MWHLRGLLEGYYRSQPFTALNAELNHLKKKKKEICASNVNLDWIHVQFVHNVFYHL